MSSTLMKYGLCTPSFISLSSQKHRKMVSIAIYVNSKVTSCLQVQKFFVTE